MTALRGTRSILATAALAAWLCHSRPALAAAPRECIEGHEQGQIERRAGKLRAARTAFVTCAADACPAEVRKECGAWLSDVEASVPTVVFEARDGTRSISDVRVLVDGEERLARLDGRALDIDPGPHRVRFEMAGGRVREEQILVSEGEKRRRVTIELGEPSPPPKATVVADSPPPLAATRTLPLAAYILGGAALAGLATFGIFGVAGYTKEESLASRCAPVCEKGDVDAVSRSYLAADIGAAAGLVFAVAAVVVGWPRPSKDVARTTKPSLVVRPSTVGLGARITY